MHRAYEKTLVHRVTIFHDLFALNLMFFLLQHVYRPTCCGISTV